MRGSKVVLRAYLISFLVSKLGECRTLWGERERAVTKSDLTSYSEHLIYLNIKSLSQY